MDKKLLTTFGIALAAVWASKNVGFIRNIVG